MTQEETPGQRLVRKWREQHVYTVDIYDEDAADALAAAIDAAMELAAEIAVDEAMAAIRAQVIARQ